MSKEKSSHEKTIDPINNAPVVNKHPITDKEEKNCSTPEFQAEDKKSVNTDEQRDSNSSDNTPIKNMKPDISAKGDNGCPIPKTSTDSMDCGNPIQQQVLPAKNTLLQMWHFFEGLIKVLTFFIVTYTLLITRIQAGIMQDQIIEMQKDRNESYKAVIVANPIQENMHLSAGAKTEAGHTVYYYFLSGFDVLSSNSYNKKEYYEMFISDNHYVDQTFTPITFANIGPGIATRVKFSWDNDNIDRLYQTLLEYDNDPSKYLVKQEDLINYRRHEYSTSLESVDFNYMKSNLAETYSIELPTIYSILFSEIFLNYYDSAKEKPVANPSVNLTVEFSDTQGIAYYETITLTAAKPKRQVNGTAGGSLSYTITINHSDPVKK